MKGNYAPDKFTEADVLRALDQAGLKWKDGRRYILSQCPLHDDEHPSVQIYKDDWFANCHSGCGRFHITKAFPDLRQTNSGTYQQIKRSSGDSPVSEQQYKTVDLMEFWKSLPLIPREHKFKNLPLEVLNELGWRYDLNGNRYFIPYFSASKSTIPFAQWRNLGDGPRFNFWKDAKPTCYGTWNLDNHKLFVVEGASDAAVLDYAAVPWIAVPSASSDALAKAMAAYCQQNGITIVFAGDNDSAGSKVREALDSVGPYRVKQPPPKYKDWADFYEAEGVEVLQDYCMTELMPKKLPASIQSEVTAEEVSSELENVQQVFPEAVQVPLIDDTPKSKELSGVPNVLY